MSDQALRRKLIRLAYEKPELRPDLLPILAGRSRNAGAGRPVTHWILWAFEDGTTSRDSWLPMMGRPSKASFQKVLQRRPDVVYAKLVTVDGSRKVAEYGDRSLEKAVDQLPLSGMVHTQGRW
jgi:hypothetical protein